MYTGCIKKVDNFETALSLAKRRQLLSFLLILLGYLRCRINKNILKFKCFKPKVCVFSNTSKMACARDLKA